MHDSYLEWNSALFAASFFKMPYKKNDSQTVRVLPIPVEGITSRSSLALVIAYNADSGLFNSVTDIAHKALSPRTYQCHLCALTHSTFGMHKSWKEFLKTLEIPLEFLHADDLKTRYRTGEVQLPAIFKNDGQQLGLLIDSDSINECRTIDELKQLIRDSLG